MTARILPLDTPVIVYVPHYRAAGSLWERVAERGTDYTARNTTIRHAGRQAGPWGTRARDCATPETFTRAARGILRPHS